MAEVSSNYSIDQRGTVLSGLQVPIYQSTHIYQGMMVTALTASGYAVGPAAGSNGAVLGVAKFEQDNSSGSSNDLSVDLLCGEFTFDNYSTHPLTAAYVGKVCYAYNGRTLSCNSGDGPVAGIFLGFPAAADGTANTGKAIVYINPETNYLLSQATLESDLSNTGTGKGASMVAIEDAGTFTSEEDVEAALQELYQDALTATAELPLPLGSFQTADGTALAKYSAANDGSVGLYGAGRSYGIRWNNTGATTATIATTFKVPADCDVTAAAVVKIKCAKVGATIGDATTFVVGMYAQTEGALYDAGANLGATTSAVTGDATSKTVQLVDATLTVFPAVASGMTLTINPTAAKLGTDDIIIFDVWIEYQRKLRTA